MHIKKIIVSTVMAFVFNAAVFAQSPHAKLLILDPVAMQAFGSDVKTEVLAEGFTWSEGPVWVASSKTLYFSDVPTSLLYSWSREEGSKVAFDPSGVPVKTKGFREPGTNGLILAPDGRLIAANHGTRRVEFIDTLTGKRQPLATEYNGKRFNSPNDIVLDSDGSLYFTDPPYGLAGLNASPLKELPHNGVYHLDGEGKVTLVDDSLTFPNGIALSNDKSHLYVAISDPENPYIMRYSRDAAGRFGAGKVWFDATKFVQEGRQGNLDGMVVAPSGHVFATGPGGVYIVSPQGKLIGLIEMDRKVANCTFDEDGSLFVTASDLLLKINFAGK